MSFYETIANDNEAADQISRLFTDVRNFLSFHCPDVPRIHQTHADTEPAHVVMAMMVMMTMTTMMRMMVMMTCTMLMTAIMMAMIETLNT